MPVEVLSRACKKWGQIFMQGYGMTETSPLLTVLDSADHILEGTPEQVRRLSRVVKKYSVLKFVSSI